MYKFLKEQRKKRLVTDEMLDLYKGIFINQEQYDELRAIEVSVS